MYAWIRKADREHSVRIGAFGGRHVVDADHRPIVISPIGTVAVIKDRPYALSIKNRRADRVGQIYVERFRTFEEVVIGDRNRHRLSLLTNGEIRRS